MRIHYAYGRSLADLEEADGGAAGDAVLTEKEGAAGHRSPLLLARLRSGALDADAIAHEVVPDLVRHCPVWQAADEELRRLRREVRHWDEVIVAMEGADAPALWARLGGLSQDAQLRAVDEDEKYHHWGLCRLLLAAGLEEAAAGRAARAARLALLAVRISRHLGEGYDAAWVADLTAIGLARLGMARRLLGEPHSAGQAFAAAGTWCARGTGDPQVEAQILAQEAVLRRDQRRLGEAVALLERVEALLGGEEWAVAGGELEGMSGAELLLQKAWCLHHLGRPEAAAPLLAAAASRLGESRGGAAAALRTWLWCGEVWSAIALGRVEEADGRLAAAVERAAALGQAEVPVLLGRAGARLRLAGGDRQAAKRQLDAAALALVAHQAGIEAGLTWLDLASVFLEERDDAALRDLADQVLPAFGPAEVGRDAMASLLLFQQACREGRLTAELIAVLASRLEEARRPSLAWWSAPPAAARAEGEVAPAGRS